MKIESRTFEMQIDREALNRAVRRPTRSATSGVAFVRVTDPVQLASVIVESLDALDLEQLRRLVPDRFLGWLDDYLQDADGWRAIEQLAGTPRHVTAARLVAPDTARLTIRGPRGEAVVTARFDEQNRLKGFALDGEDYEGVGTIVISCPTGRMRELRAFYAALVGENVRQRPRLAFGEGHSYRAPRWPDPNHPQQMHLDIRARQPDHMHRVVTQRGATLLADAGEHRVYADPVGHPFCIYPADVDALWRVVIDCPDADQLRAFYAELLGTDPVPTLSFQEVSPYVAPRWPDPVFPAQLHFDVKVDDRASIQERIERRGAIRLPEGGSCPVFADPAGHPFCLCLHGE